MNTVSVAYELSESGRKDAALRGLPAAQYQIMQVPVDALSEPVREHVYVDETGKAWISLVRHTGSPAPRGAQLLAIEAWRLEYYHSAYCRAEDESQANYATANARNELDSAPDSPSALVQIMHQRLGSKAAAERLASEAEARIKARKLVEEKRAAELAEEQRRAKQSAREAEVIEMFRAGKLYVQSTRGIQRL